MIISDIGIYIWVICSLSVFGITRMFFSRAYFYSTAPISSFFTRVIMSVFLGFVIMTFIGVYF